MLTMEMRVLKRAADLLGSERELARHLLASQADLALWVSGVLAPSRLMLLRAIDVLIEQGDTSGLGELHSLAPGHADGPHVQMSVWCDGSTGDNSG